MGRKIEFDFGGKKKIAKTRKINLAKGLALGAVTGSALGTLGALLFAPKSGKETRQQIKDDVAKAAKKAADEVKEASGKAVVSIKDLAVKANELVNEKIMVRKDSCCCGETAASLETAESADNAEDVQSTETCEACEEQPVEE